MEDSFKENISVAFIESNTTGTGKLFVNKAIQKGFQVYFLTADSKKYSFLDELLIHPILIDTNNVEQVFNFLKELKKLKAVFSTSEYFVEVASRVSKMLEFDCLSVDAIINCRDKYSLFNRLRNYEVSTPFTRIIRSLDEVLALSSVLEYPVVVKPNFGSGSIGVKLCNDSEDFINHSKFLIEDKIGEYTDILVQEYIDGDEFSVEAICFDNICHVLGITKKHLGLLPCFVEVGHDFPAILSDQDKEKITEVAIKSLQALDYNFGPVHIELRLNDNGAFIIEINPRLVGGMVPVLIEQALGINVVEEIIELYVYGKCNLEPSRNFNSGIRFLLAEKAGILTEINGMDRAHLFPNIICVEKYKKIGEEINIKGDFRDRLGYVIAAAKDINGCCDSIQEAIKEISFVISDQPHSSNEVSSETSFFRERLSVDFDPAVVDVLNPKKTDFFLSELKKIAEIDKAHLIMLEETGIVDHGKISLILKEISELEKQEYSSLKNNSSFRGSYLVYENFLVEQLGIDVGGVIHTARSRNDINATLFKLKVRDIYVEVYRVLWKLRSTLLEVAAKSKDIILPVYSQYQPALPGTYSYYLLAIEEALSKDQAALKSCLELINTSTLGAGAGAGTTFPTNPLITMELLGFDTLYKNALDVVANRDLALRLFSVGSFIGTTVSRIAQDFQMWTTQEFSFFELPGSLCGTSSSMPQKKNPYLLEKIKGKVSQIIGTLFSALNTMHKVPFSNSVEVGTEALFGFESSFEALIQAVKLLGKIVCQARPVTNSIMVSYKKGLIYAPGLTESLVKNNNLSFRKAHQLVGEIISSAISEQKDPLLRMISEIKELKDNPLCWHKDFNYGKGPGVISVEKMLNEAVSRLNDDTVFISKVITKWEKAKSLLNEKVKQFII